MEIQKIKIQDIKIENRIRKDYGNIEELAQSIKEHGLLQPIVITPDNILIAGERRLKAVTLLGAEEISAIIKTAIDREEQLLCEIEENEKRKEFTPSERVTYGLELEQIERIKAEERRLSNLTHNHNTDKPHGVYQTDMGTTNEIVGKKVGMKRESYRRAKSVVENGNKKIIEKMDSKEIGIHTAYEIVKGKRTEDGKPIQQQIKEEPKQEVKQIKSAETTVDFSFLTEENNCAEEDDEFNQILNETIAEAELMANFKNAICVPVVADFLTKSLKEKLKQYPDILENSDNEERKAFVNLFNLLKKIIIKGA